MQDMIDMDFRRLREELVEHGIRRKGIEDPAVLDAMRAVPREAFIPDDLLEFAYRNAPLPIGHGQTISQPFVVAYMAAALELKPEDRVLEIGAGSGYAAAVLAHLADEVYTVERYGELADAAERRLRKLGIVNVHVLQGDGTLGWPEHGPYDAIIVAAGGPHVPAPLLEQLQIGGRLVIPVRSDGDTQNLIRVRHVRDGVFEEEDLGCVRFVPLIGAAGWQDESARDASEPQRRPLGRRRSGAAAVSTLIHDESEPISDIEGCDLGPLLERIGDSRLVLIGEATHGTSEFYRMRAEITKSLINHLGFDFVAVEADWPDASRINEYVVHREAQSDQKWEAFERFPTWMWRNREVLDFLEWLRTANLQRPDPLQRTAFYGLDLYNMYGSIRAVLEYLDRVDPATARVARERYGCLMPWEKDAATYGRAALTGKYRSCEQDVVAMLRDLLEKQREYSRYDGEYFMDAALNARLIANAEEYYRIMYYGSAESWNKRDAHMFDTLESLLEYHGADSRGVVWAHNSHLGDAAHTEMMSRGEFNLGHLCRERFGEKAYLIGQATHTGTVAAAPMWDEPMEVIDVRPSLDRSYERLMHESERDACFLHLRDPQRPELREALLETRLQRAIGVIYRPQTERQSHYFRASLPQQFDELIWFDRSHAIHALSRHETVHHPFATFD